MHELSSSLCSIIIPAFNQAEYTRRCLESLFLEPAGHDFEVIVVDNGSRDETPGILAEFEQHKPNVRTIRFAENRGYSVANNEAARVAKGSQLVFLNNDTILTPLWLKELVAARERHPRAGVIGCKLLYPESKRINHAGYVYNAELRTFYMLYELQKESLPGANVERELQAVLGACMLVPRALFFEVGMFSDYGLEDIDLCLKVRERGYEVWYTPRSCIYHYGSITLLNSDPATLPKAGTEEFNRRWPAEKLCWDDREIYASDGYGFAYTKEGRVVVLHKDGKVLALDETGQAGEGRALADIEARVLMEPDNIAPRLDRVLYFIERGRLVEAERSLEEIEKEFPTYYEAQVARTELLHKIGKSAEARELAGGLLSNPHVPATLKRRAADLLSNS